MDSELPILSQLKNKHFYITQNILYDYNVMVIEEQNFPSQALECLLKREK